MVPGFVYVPYNDVAAVAAVLDDQTAAVMVEPIQGEGGINIPATGYLQELRRLCDLRGVLLILDEVQTGMGRTGEWFAYQHCGVVPDILTCAKAIAGGIAAGVMIARPAVAAVLQPGMHASTFGGNPIACRAALAAIETIEADGLLERGTKIGARFREEFEALKPRIAQLGSRRPDHGHNDRSGSDDRCDRDCCRVHAATALDQCHPRPCCQALAGINDQRRSD